MNVKITESGRYADSAPHLPQRTVVEGETRSDLSDHIVQAIIKSGCGIEVEPDETEEETEEKGSDETTGTKGSTDSDAIREELVGLISKVEEKKAQKQVLEDWGRQRLDFDVDKRMDIESIINKLVEVAAK